MKQKESITKKRNWAFVGYPESLPSDWIERLKLTGLQCAISPLHDKDLEADETTLKKPHYHVILVYGSPTTYRNVLILTQSLRSTNPISLEQIRGYYRYFTHKDNPEKYQYDEKDIVSLNGFNIIDFVESTKSEILKTKKSLLTVINNLKITEYNVFMDYVLLNGTDLEFDIASCNTIFFDRYLSSRRHNTFNPETGEVE